jgi:hypothetical protein
MQISSRGDLREQVREHFATADIGKAKEADRIIYFLHTVLTLKNGVTSEGAPFLGWLQGLVAAELYTQASRTVSRNLRSVVAQGMTQSLVIEKITDFDVERRDGRETGRISAIVHGTLAIQATKTSKGGALALPQPYRALVVIDTLPVTNLNPYGYYLVSLREATGAAETRRFDKEMEEKRERSRGKS